MSDRMFNVFFTVATVIGLGVTGVVVWAVIVLVNHFAH